MQRQHGFVDYENVEVFVIELLINAKNEEFFTWNDLQMTFDYWSGSYKTVGYNRTN